MRQFEADFPAVRTDWKAAAFDQSDLKQHSSVRRSVGDSVDTRFRHNLAGTMFLGHRPSTKPRSDVPT
jgi:hypothetical protein